MGMAAHVRIVDSMNWLAESVSLVVVTGCGHAELVLRLQ
jgi:hypothetical protein